jgi:NADH dehydrogenase
MRTIVLVGGGFAGVYAARHLRRQLGRDWEIILFSQENHFIFTPLLGEVVGAAINPLHVVCPIRQMVPGVTCRTTALTALDVPGRQVHYPTAAGQPTRQTFDHLVLACGSAVNLDIIPGMAAHGWPLKTMGDALLLRNHIIGQLEKAEFETDPERRRRLLSVAVVGAGFSGVEVTGEIADFLRGSSRFYRGHKPGELRVNLLEGRDRILPDLPESLSRFAHGKMSRRGIVIHTGAVAREVTESGVRLRDGSLVESGTVVCTIGTTVVPLVVTAGLPLVNNRIRTGGDLRVEGWENVWALGDCAAVPNAYDEKVSPPTAQLALRQASQLADNLASATRGQPTRPFAYKPRGMLASIGGHKAVGTVFGLKVSGFPAWFVWRGFYLSKMPTLARKIQIAFDWAWQLLFPRDIVQLQLEATQRLARAHYEPGQYVFHKGDAGDRFFVIERGRAGVYLDETAPPVATLGAGEHFGEVALLRTVPRSASVRAEEPLDVLMIGKAPFAQLAGSLAVLRAALERSVQGAVSSAELLRRAREDPRLAEVRVRDVMSRPVATLPLALTFAEALQRSREGGKGAYPVVDEAGRLTGIVTRTDFYNALQRLQAPQTPLGDIMRRPVITVREGDTLTTALLTFLRAPIKRVVVVGDDDPGRPVGMVTPFDVVQVLGEETMVAPASGERRSPVNSLPQ